jgi:hypothetical protein
MSFLEQLRAEVGWLKNAALALPRWCASFFDPTNPKTSSKRLAMIAGVLTLCWSHVRITTALARELEKGIHSTMADVFLLASSAVPLAAMAGAVYGFKSDGTITVGGTPNITGETSPPEQLNKGEPP